MSVLRIFCTAPEAPPSVQWALAGDGATLKGEGPFALLPRTAERVELVIAAAQVLITRVRLPGPAGRRSESLLAYAIEERLATEPDADQVSRLGSNGDAEVIAAVNRKALENWRIALGAAGIDGYGVCCETLMLPWQAGTWSMAWNGEEGFVRTGEFEGGATDRGDRQSPPLALRLMIEDARARNQAPDSIALYLTTSEAAPDVAAWQRSLGISFLPAQPWDWRSAPHGAGIALMQRRRRWPPEFDRPAKLRLRRVAWIAAVALAIHAVALGADWIRLAGAQRSLQQKMEVRFRTLFPEAVAVANPALQMRRKLAEARHAAGRNDDSDFPKLIVQVAAGLKELPLGAVRVVSYENGRMTLELAVTEESVVRRITARLTEAGLRVEPVPPARRAGRDTVTLTVGAS